MNVSKYVKEDEQSVLTVIDNCENMVDVPSDFLVSKSKRTQTYAPDSDRVVAALGRNYTVLAREGEQVVGLASMDGEGNVGFLAVCEGENEDKVASALLRALERRAEKKEIPHLVVLSTPRSEKVLSRRGFVPYDNNGDGESLMVKEIISKDEQSFSADKVKRLRLDPSKPIKVEGKSSVLPWVLLIIAVLFAVLLVSLSFANYRDYDAADAIKKLLPFILIVGAFVIAATVVFTLYVVRGRAFRKEVLSMAITNGMIVSDITTNQSGRRQRNGRYEYAFCEVSFTYVFYDENMKKRSETYRHKYQHSAPYFYKGQELVVAFSKEKSYLLGKYTFADSGESLLNTDKAISAAPPTEEESGFSGPVGVNVDNLKPLETQGGYALFPLYIFLTWCVVVIATCVFNYLTSKQTGRSFWNAPLPLALFAAISTVILLGAALFFAFPILRASINYNKLRRSNVKYAQGKLICQDSVYSADNKNAFFCVYKTVYGEEKRIKIPRMFAQDKVKNGDKNVVVAYDGSVAVALIPKTKKK